MTQLTLRAEFSLTCSFVFTTLLADNHAGYERYYRALRSFLEAQPFGSSIE